MDNKDDQEPSKLHLPTTSQEADGWTLTHIFSILFLEETSQHRLNPEGCVGWALPPRPHLKLLGLMTEFMIQQHKPEKHCGHPRGP